MISLNIISYKYYKYYKANITEECQARGTGPIGVFGHSDTRLSDYCNYKVIKDNQDKVRITDRYKIPTKIVSNFIFKLLYILNNTGIEYEIKNYCGRNFGTDGNSNFTLLGECVIQ